MPNKLKLALSLAQLCHSLLFLIFARTGFPARHDQAQAGAHRERGQPGRAEWDQQAGGLLLQQVCSCGP